MSKKILALIFVLAMLSACAVPQPTQTPTIVTPAPTQAPTIVTPVPTPVPPIANAEQLWARAQSCNCLTAYAMPDIGDSIILQAINSAKKSVRMKMYLFTRDSVRDALLAAGARGIDVRILMELNPYGGTTTNVDLYNAVKGTSIKMRWSSFDFRFTHEKSLVIDDQVAFIMTHNITSSSFNANREYGIMDSRPEDVAEIVKVFEADWEKQPVDLKNPRLVWSPINARQKLVELIDSAKVSIDIQQSDFGAPQIVERVLQAAQRGVKVRGMFSPNDPITSDSAEPNRDLIRRAGAQIKYMSDPYIHAKMFLVDGQRAYVGSINMSDNSLNNNRELGIIFDQADAIQVVRQAFEKDWGRGTVEPFPVSEFQIPANGVVNWKDAMKVVNREITIEGQITKIYNSGRVMWLQFSEDWEKDMKVVIFPSDWGKWPQRPDLIYFGKTIRVTGKVVLYQGAPEIIINDPKVISIVGQ